MSCSDEIFALVCDSSCVSSPHECQEAYKRISRLCERRLTGTDATLYDYLQSCPDFLPRSLPHCGHIFSRDEIILHCDDCAVDETCVLCVECFQQEDHKGHRYRYYLSQGSGGSCDCGEEESWKRPLSCPAHAKRPLAIDSHQLSDDELFVATRLQQFFQQFGPFFHQGMLRFETSLGNGVTDFEEPYCLVLFNDEQHSFDQVIDVLNRSIRVDYRTAEEFAKLVDEQGFAPVKVCDGKDECDAARISVDIIESIGLEAHLIERSVVDCFMALNFVLQWLGRVASEQSFLVRPIMEGLLSPNYGLVGLLFQKEHVFSKAQRQTIQSILTMALSLQDVKETLAAAFIQNSVTLFVNQCNKLDREAHLTILQFAVQIFTVPSIVAFVCRQNLVPRCIGNIAHVFRHVAEQGLDEDSTPQHAVQSLIHILQYILRDGDAIEKGWLLDFENVWQPFNEALLHVQASFPIERIEGEHIVFEQYNWPNEAIFSLTTMGLIFHFTELLTHRDSVVKFFNLLQQSHADRLDRLTVGTSVVSFQQQSVWFLGALLHRYSMLPGEPFVPILIDEGIAQIAAHNMAILCQIKTSLWIRNGNRVFGQVHYADLCHYL